MATDPEPLSDAGAERVCSAGGVPRAGGDSALQHADGPGLHRAELLPLQGSAHQCGGEAPSAPPAVSTLTPARGGWSARRHRAGGAARHEAAPTQPFTAFGIKFSASTANSLTYHVTPPHPLPPPYSRPFRGSQFPSIRRPPTPAHAVIKLQTQEQFLVPCYRAALGLASVARAQQSSRGLAHPAGVLRWTTGKGVGDPSKH